MEAATQDAVKRQELRPDLYPVTPGQNEAMIPGRWVYVFGGGKADGRADMRDLLGGKGANLAEMSAIGVPVPPGFTVTTEVCTYFYDNGRTYPEDLKDQVSNGLAQIEKSLDAKFGDPSKPLLVSVRSGARTSMPGMMDTVLNLGLNDETVEGLAAQSGDPRFAYDSYRRFIQMYADVVLGIDHYSFEERLDLAKDDKGVHQDTELDADDLKALVEDFKSLVETEYGEPFPQDPKDQLWGAIGAVFGSWMNQRAITYRTPPQYSGRLGYGRHRSVHGIRQYGRRLCHRCVFLTRSIDRGKMRLWEYLVNAQGEDVVAGIRTPQQITTVGKEAQASTLPAMEESMPDMYAELVAVRDRLERHYRDMQDMEFTIQKGRLWMLQTRTGKRTAKAALKIAVDLASEGLVTKDEAVARIDPSQLDQLLHPTLDPDAPRTLLTRGLPASPGAAAGQNRIYGGRGRRLGQKRRTCRPGAARNQPGRHWRHARGRRHFDLSRRHDQPRCGGRAWHGHAPVYRALARSRSTPKKSFSGCEITFFTKATS